MLSDLLGGKPVAPIGGNEAKSNLGETTDLGAAGELASVAAGKVGTAKDGTNRGGARPGAGRQKSKETLVKIASGAVPPPLPAKEEIENAAHVEALVADLLLYLDESRISHIYSLCKKAGFDESRCVEFKERAGVSATVKRIVPKSAYRLALKYALLGEYGDEILCLVSIAADQARFFSLKRDIEKMIADKNPPPIIAVASSESPAPGTVVRGHHVPGPVIPQV